MKGLSARELLSVFERGQGQDPLTRGLLLLMYALPELDRQAREGLPVGDRDRALTMLRVATFGTSAPLFAVCPHCQAEVESELDLAGLLAGVTGPDGSSDRATFQHDDREYRYRRPSSSDLRAALEAGAAAEVVIATRCLAAPSEVSSPLDAELLAAFSDVLVADDPWSEIALDLACPDCSGRWRIVFDIIEYFWREIDVRARRLLREVHALARAYGWGEDEILELSPLRRQLYLGMVAA